LDDWTLRENAVRDIGALLDWIAEQPELDQDRVVVTGGSYGGYMVLASLVHYGSRFRCGIDVVGLSNFVTFLENTADYRKDVRRAEYGDERIPEMRAFLQDISPLNNAERITSRLMVVQGANDPRVPVGESRQIVDRVRANGLDVSYVEAADEGHGFRKPWNALWTGLAQRAFTDRCLFEDP
jgi:dipeptidyl aminopeptidase/acylaminoacyl peptidase